MLIGITPGRALRWAPRWDDSEDTVLFDAASGDYWLLTADGRTVVEWLQAEPVLSHDDLLARLAAVTTDGLALIGNLASAGLLTGLEGGVSTALPSVVDDDGD